MPRYCNVNSSGALHSKHAQAASPPCRRATLAGRAIGDVGYPCLIGRWHIKLLLQVVGRYSTGPTVFVSRTTSISRLGAYSVLANESGDAMPTATLAYVTQIMGDLTVAVDTATVFPALPNQTQ